MSILPILTAAKILQALLRGGYYVARQIGSHVQLKHPKDPRILVTVARHSRDITRSTLSSILRQARLTAEEFLKLLGR
ncbi:MAG: type II toxin-antitoxin system HicA family toxin [Patescibacteria group bacterium]|mgnify:CR=1 FL=1